MDSEDGAIASLAFSDEIPVPVESPNHFSPFILTALSSRKATKSLDSFAYFVVFVWGDGAPRTPEGRTPFGPTSTIERHTNVGPLGASGGDDAPACVKAKCRLRQ
jgi:hypothetical protein